jgi:ketosteroid isomerase-like protein
MKKIILSAFACLFLLTIISAQNKDEKSIRQMLENQTKAWNNGNLEAFMDGYIHSDSLLFVGKNGPKYGFKTTLENYKRSYPDTASMGNLTFTILQMKPLSATHYFVLGKWHLHRTIGNVEGYFTLLLQKIKNKWMIIADHSS